MNVISFVGHVIRTFKYSLGVRLASEHIINLSYVRWTTNNSDKFAKVKQHDKYTRTISMAPTYFNGNTNSIFILLHLLVYFFFFIYSRKKNNMISNILIKYNSTAYGRIHFLFDSSVFLFVCFIIKQILILLLFHFNSPL